MADENAFAKQSDTELVNLSRGALGAHAVEMVRRLTDMIERELHAAHELSAKVHRLNQALLWYTIALAVMAAFQFGEWIRDITR
jgi:hypothetical protein